MSMQWLNFAGSLVGLELAVNQTPWAESGEPPANSTSRSGSLRKLFGLEANRLVLKRKFESRVQTRATATLLVL